MKPLNLMDAGRAQAKISIALFAIGSLFKMRFDGRFLQAALVERDVNQAVNARPEFLGNAELMLTCVLQQTLEQWFWHVVWRLLCRCSDSAKPERPVGFG